MGCRASLRSRNLCYQGARQPANKSSNKRRWENKRLIKKYSKSKMDPTRGSTTLRTFWQTSSGTTLCHPPIVYIVTLCLWRQGYHAVKILVEKTDIEDDEVDYLREITPPFFQILNAGRLHEEGILALAFLHLVELIRGGHRTKLEQVIGRFPL